MDKKKKSNILTFIYIIINIAVIGAIFILNPELKNVGSVIERINMKWILGSIASMFIFWLLDSAALNGIMKFVFDKSDFIESFKITMIGKYYAAITPAGSGGQASQLVYMSRWGMPGGRSVSALMIKYWVYQIVLGVYALIAFFVEQNFIRGYSPILFWAAIIGFAITVGVPLLFYFLSIKDGFLTNLFLKIIQLLKKIKLIKQDEKFSVRFISYVEDYSNSVRLIKRNKKMLVAPIIITIVQLPFYLGVPYLIYRGYGLSGTGLWNFIFMNIFLYFAASFFPTPGGTGVSEGAFYILFKLFFPKDALVVALLLWRIVSYYLLVASGGLVILLDSLRKMKRSPKIT